MVNILYNYYLWRCWYFL